MQYYKVREQYPDGETTYSPPLLKPHAESLKIKLEQKAIGNWPQYHIFKV
jgi:hypothetical protein